MTCFKFRKEYPFMQWHYATNGRQHGPVTQTDFDKLVAEGVITPDTLVWHQGLGNWQPYSKIASGTPATGEGDTAICAMSGKTYPKREMIQYEGRWISAEHKDEYFQRLREGAAMPGTDTVPGPYGYGRFLQRFCARFVDGLITGVVAMIFGAIIGAIFGASGSLRTGNSSGALLMQAVVQLLSLSIGISYEIYFIRRQDATPGKKALGLKLLRADGSKLSVGRIIGRYFAQWLSAIPLLIGYFMAAFDKEGRSLHDRICDTRVIKTK
jgi:uncharacterized RDD family membrane protein YckC